MIQLPPRRRPRRLLTVLLGLSGTGVLIGAWWAWIAAPIHAVAALTKSGERVHDYLGGESDHFFVAPSLMLGLLTVVAVVAVDTTVAVVIMVVVLTVAVRQVVTTAATVKPCNFKKILFLIKAIFACYCVPVRVNCNLAKMAFLVYFLNTGLKRVVAGIALVASPQKKARRILLWRRAYIV